MTTRDNIIQAIDVARKKFLATGRDRPNGAWLGDAADAILALSPPEPTEGLAAELEAWPATGKGDGMDAAVVKRLMSRAVAALRAMPLQQETKS